MGYYELAEGNEQKKKRMKADSDMPRLSPSMRHQEALANLKGEQVISQLLSDTFFAILHLCSASNDFHALG